MAKVIDGNPVEGPICAQIVEFGVSDVLAFGIHGKSRKSKSDKAKRRLTDTCPTGILPRFAKKPQVVVDLRRESVASRHSVTCCLLENVRSNFNTHTIVLFGRLKGFSETFDRIFTRQT